MYYCAVYNLLSFWNHYIISLGMVKPAYLAVWKPIFLIHSIILATLPLLRWLFLSNHCFPILICVGSEFTLNAHAAARFMIRQYRYHHSSCVASECLRLPRNNMNWHSFVLLWILPGIQLSVLSLWSCLCKLPTHVEAWQFLFITIIHK